MSIGIFAASARRALGRQRHDGDAVGILQRSANQAIHRMKPLRYSTGDSFFFFCSPMHRDARGQPVIFDILAEKLHEAGGPVVDEPHKESSAATANVTGSGGKRSDTPTSRFSSLDKRESRCGCGASAPLFSATACVAGEAVTTGSVGQAGGVVAQ